MKQLSSLLWKEWCEVRIFLGIGLFVFLGLPLIGALENRGSHIELLSSMWVFMLGGVLTVIIAVGVVVRDLNGRLEEFWRSRPVSTARWLIVKYVVGLAVVMTTLALPLVVQMMVNRKGAWRTMDEADVLLRWHPYFWAAAYSLSFAAASLIRRGANAAMLSISMLLLLYFLPSILPPIGFLSLGRVMDPDHISMGSQVAFVMGMLGLTVIGLLVSLAAAYRDWRIESDRKMIYWSIGGSLLILFSSAVFQVASNMQVVQKIDVLPNERVTEIYSDGKIGVALSLTGRDPRSAASFRTQFFARKLQIGESGVEIGPPIELERDDSMSWQTIWRPEHPDVFYHRNDYWEQETQEQYPRLEVISIHDGKSTIEVLSFPEQMERDWRKWPFGSRLFAWHDRLYLFSAKLMTFDISDPVKPRLLSTEPFSRAPMGGEREEWWRSINHDDAEVVLTPLPPIPEIPAEERLKMNFRGFWAQLDGDILVQSFGDHLTTYRLEKLTDTLATFRRVGRYDPTPVEILFGRSVGRTVALGGLFYESGINDMGARMSITAYDITGTRPRPVGHFAFPDDSIFEMLPLPGGRLLAASANNHLYVLGPPRGRK